MRGRKLYITQFIIFVLILIAGYFTYVVHSRYEYVSHMRVIAQVNMSEVKYKKQPQTVVYQLEHAKSTMYPYVVTARFGELTQTRRSLGAFTTKFPTSPDGYVQGVEVRSSRLYALPFTKADPRHVPLNLLFLDEVAYRNYKKAKMADLNNLQLTLAGVTTGLVLISIILNFVLYKKLTK